MKSLEQSDIYNELGGYMYTDVNRRLNDDSLGLCRYKICMQCMNALVI